MGIIIPLLIMCDIIIVIYHEEKMPDIEAE